MSIYRVHVILEETYDNIEADNPDEAFIIASDMAMEGGCWQHDEEVIEE